MSENVDMVDDGGLFGFVPKQPLVFDPHAAAREQARARHEAAEKADLARRVANLPTRDELAVQAMDIFTSTFPADTKLKAMQFYAQLMGFMDKDNKPNKNGKEDTGSKIMQVPMMSSAEDWETHAKAYQNKLEKLANAG